MFDDRFFDRPFGSVFRRMEEEMAEMERRADRLLRDAIESGTPGRAGPFVWGYTIETGPDGEPEVTRFGNLGQSRQALEEGWREPFVTSFVDEDDRTLHVTAELPGVDKSSIDVEVRERELRLKVEGDERKYRKRIAVGEELDPETARASYNNGILEVTCKLADDEETGRKVDIA